MKPYDKSNSFMQRVTKRVSEFLPGTTWVNSLLGESQTGNDPPSPGENDDRPPVKKLCTSNNTFTNVNNRTRLDSNSADNHRSSYVNVLSPELSAVTCKPSTSRQSSKFSTPSYSPTSHDVGARSSIKRKSDAVDLSSTTRPSQKALAFNFASSTPAVVTTNKQPMAVNHSSRSSLHSESQCISNDFLTRSSTTKLFKPRDDSPSLLHLRDTTVKHDEVPSFRWDTFVNYGELSERQKLFAQRSPLNCSQVMYGGRSASSNLSKILGHTPPIHKKTTIPISSSSNSEIRTTSSVLLNHISTKDKEIEENKFIIRPRGHSIHKADHKSVPVQIETTVNIVDDTPEKTEEKSNNNSLIYCGRDTSRKLRANISRKARGQPCDRLEMPDKVDLPNVSLSVPVLPSISLSNINNTNSEDCEFTFNQPLTLEQFGLQIAEKSLRKKLNSESSSKKPLSSNASNEDLHSSSVASSPSVNAFTNQATKGLVTSKYAVKVVSPSDVVTSKPLKFEDSSKNTLKTIENHDLSSEPTKPTNTFFGNSPQSFKTADKNQQQPEKLSVEPKKWSCDTCWVVNDGDKLNCVACQTSKPDKSQKPLSVSKSSNTLTTSESCLVSNKNASDTSVVHQTQLIPDTTKKIDQCSNWTCDDCWVKNKHDSNSCVSCGAVRPGSAPEKKPQLSTQFNFGLNNNALDKSGGSQFKFGFGTKIEQSSSQFQFGNPATQTNPEDSKSDAPGIKFKFGEGVTKSHEGFGTFKFGSGCATKEPEQKLAANQPLSQFKFGFDKKTDQPEGQFNFGFEKKADQPEGQLKFGFDSIKSVPVLKHNSDETGKSVQQNCRTDTSKATRSNNESLSTVNANEMSAKLAGTQSMGGQLQFGDAKLINKCAPVFTFGSAKTNCSDSNTLSSNGNNNEDVSKEKYVLHKKDNIETKPVESTNTSQMMNGHSHPKDDQKPGSIKTPQLFSFGSLAKQDQTLPNNQNKPEPPSMFGSGPNDNKASFTPMFGANTSVFGNGPTSTSSTPQFSFGSIAPANDGYFSKTTKDGGKPSIPDSFASTTKVSFSFGAQSRPAFSTANAAGLFTKSAVQGNDHGKNVSNNLFNQSSINPSVKLDPNAPISINFTGGATTQFTAKPETTEPPAKRKILKPVRKIR